MEALKGTWYLGVVRHGVQSTSRAGFIRLSSLSQEGSGAFGGPGHWWWRPALQIWEAGCRGHKEGMISILGLVAKCWSLWGLLRSWGPERKLQ